MPRLIDADALGLNDFEIILCDGSYKEALKMLLNKIETAPTVEERKTGEWIHIRDEENGNGLYECPICHRGDIHAPEVKVNFCWNCGAKMEGGKDE